MPNQIDRLADAANRLQTAGIDHPRVRALAEWVALVLDEQTTDEDTPDLEPLVVAYEAAVASLVPKDTRPPAWRRLLTEDEQADLFDLECENIGQCTKEIAHDQLDEASPEYVAWNLLLGECEDDPTDEDVAAWIAKREEAYLARQG